MQPEATASCSGRYISLDLADEISSRLLPLSPARHQTGAPTLPAPQWPQGPPEVSLTMTTAEGRRHFCGIHYELDMGLRAGHGSQCGTVLYACPLAPFHAGESGVQSGQAACPKPCSGQEAAVVLTEEAMSLDTARRSGTGPAWGVGRWAATPETG